MWIIFLTLSALIQLSNAGWGQVASQDTGAQPAPVEPVAGGHSSADVNDPKIKDLASFAMQEINTQSNNLYLQNVIRVTEAKTQVVAGMSYTITLTSGQSTCRKTPENLVASAGSCPLSTEANASYQQCTVTIWEKRWQHFKKVTKFECSPVDAATAKGSSLRNPSHSIVQFEKPDQMDSWQTFLQFKQRFNKTYANDADQSERYSIFKSNLKMARILKMHEKGTATYGANIFADWSPDEFSKLLLSNWTRSNSAAIDIPNEPIPDNWDWREKGSVTGIKNQGLCGSCWAFAATGNVEGVWALKKGQLFSLSEQQLLDCNRFGDDCKGGSTWNAYKYILVHGLETESDYPYTARSRECKLNSTLEKAYINDSISLPKNEQQIAQYLYQHGPVAVGINILPLMLYTGGIARPWKYLCSPKLRNHAALLVGYGIENDIPYWIIKNTFGVWWGEAGYLRLYRGADVCGVDQEATSVVVL